MKCATFEGNTVRFLLNYFFMLHKSVSYYVCIKIREREGRKNGGRSEGEGREEDWKGTERRRELVTSRAYFVE